MEEIEHQINELVHAYREERLKNINSDNRQIASTMFSAEQNENLIKFQLDIKEELERIERLLRGHVPKIDNKGNEYWHEAPESERLFNEKGVKEILKILSYYLTKTIILSNYTQEQINFRVQEFGERLADFILENYVEFGLDTDEKLRHFNMIIINLVNIVEASYQRALDGMERESLRSARMVTEQVGNNQNAVMPMLPKKTSLWGKFAQKWT